jgi:secreted trypsin-like serine protease
MYDVKMLKKKKKNVKNIGLYIYYIFFKLYLSINKLFAPFISPEPSDRVIGGLPVDEGVAPYAVYIKAYSESDDLVRSCGGTIINTTLILTSARCLYG